MSTIIVPGNGQSWDDVIDTSNMKEGESLIFNDVLYLVAAHLRPMMGMSPQKLPMNKRTQLYGKILWNYFDTPPSTNAKDVGMELGHIYFAYLLRKVLEANPVVSRG